MFARGHLTCCRNHTVALDTEATVILPLPVVTSVLRRGGKRAQLTSTGLIASVSTGDDNAECDEVVVSRNWIEDTMSRTPPTDAHAFPSVITRRIGGALALATTPEEEVDNPAHAIAMPSPMSLALPALLSPISVQVASCTSQNSEVVITCATLRQSSPVFENPPNMALPLLRPQPSRPLSGSEEPPTTVPTGLPVLVVYDDALTRTLQRKHGQERLSCA
ncbi:hypothetical protein V8E53_015403 [Lactarius tabidus]